MITNNSLAGSRLKEDNNVITLPFGKLFCHTTEQRHALLTPNQCPAFVGDSPVNQTFYFLTSHLESGYTTQAGCVK